MSLVLTSEKYLSPCFGISQNTVSRDWAMENVYELQRLEWLSY